MDWRPVNSLFYSVGQYMKGPCGQPWLLEVETMIAHQILLPLPSLRIRQCKKSDTNMKLVLVGMHSNRLKKVVISWENCPSLGRYPVVPVLTNARNLWVSHQSVGCFFF